MSLVQSAKCFGVLFFQDTSDLFPFGDNCFREVLLIGVVTFLAIDGELVNFYLEDLVVTA